MYAKADIITICETLAVDLQADDTLSRFFDDTVEQLGFLTSPPFYETALVSLTSGTATYDFESDALAIYHAFMDDTLLSIVGEDDIEAYSKIWPTSSGTPIALTQDELERQYTLYPEPDFNSGTLIPTHGEPYGEDYPTNQLFLIYSKNRTADFQEQFSIPLALFSLSKEFSTSSNHQDREFAESCKTFAAFILNMIGF